MALLSTTNSKFKWNSKKEAFEFTPKFKFQKNKFDVGDSSVNNFNSELRKETDSERNNSCSQRNRSIPKGATWTKKIIEKEPKIINFQDLNASLAITNDIFMLAAKETNDKSLILDLGDFKKMEIFGNKKELFFHRGFIVFATLLFIKGDLDTLDIFKEQCSSPMIKNIFDKMKIIQGKKLNTNTFFDFLLSEYKYEDYIHETSTFMEEMINVSNFMVQDCNLNFLKNIQKNSTISEDHYLSLFSVITHNL